MVTVVVERELDYFSDAGIERGYARVFEPQRDQQDWRCDYQLTWPGYDNTKRVIGVDPWQAIQLAMFVVPSVIFSTTDFKAGRIGLWGTKAESFEHLCDLFGVKPIEGPYA